MSGAQQTNTALSYYNMHFARIVLFLSLTRGWCAPPLHCETSDNVGKVKLNFKDFNFLQPIVVGHCTKRYSCMLYIGWCVSSWNESIVFGDYVHLFYASFGTQVSVCQKGHSFSDVVVNTSIYELQKLQL